MNSRAYDMEILRRGTLSPDPTIRRQARITMERIKHEGSKVKSMRDVLIKAHRDGNVQEIKDIHDFIRNRPEYRSWGQDKTWR
jgi:hypothetical protein